MRVVKPYEIQIRAVNRSIKALASFRLDHVIELAQFFYGASERYENQARAWVRGRFIPAKWSRYPLAFAFVAMRPDVRQGDDGSDTVRADG